MTFLSKIIAEPAAKEKEVGELFEWKKPLYRGLKINDIAKLKKDTPDFNGPKFYGKGVYYHDTSWLAAQWVLDGLVVKSSPTRPLRLKKYSQRQDRIDHLKDLEEEYDGVYLSNRQQEAGPQIILRDASAMKQVGYWPYKAVETNWGAAAQLDAKKMKKKSLPT